MKKVTTSLLALLIVAAFATTALAYGPGRGPGKGFQGRGDYRGQTALNLSEEQNAKINALREAHWKEVAPLQEQVTAKRDALRKLWLEPNPDQAKITAAQKELRTLRDQMQDKGTAARLEKLKVLTPEQKEKMASFAGGRGFGPGMRGDSRRGPGQGSWGRGGRGPGMGRGADCFAAGPGPGGFGPRGRR
jgi:Spy/CpxP family protein refolding chaperone